jgi:vesicle-associated membrane protein 7
MSVLYVCIARADSSILCEYAVKPNPEISQTVRQQVLPKTQSQSKVTFEAQQRKYHVLRNTNGTVFLAVADAAYATRLAYSMLEKISGSFLQCYRDSSQQTAANCSSYSRNIKTEVEFYNGPQADKLKKLQSDIDGVKDVMLQNLDVVIQRGDKIDNLVEKSGNLAAESDTFFTQSNTLKKKMWWKNVKLIIVIVFVLALIILIISMIACGGPKYEKCKSSSS